MAARSRPARLGSARTPAAGSVLIIEFSWLSEGPSTCRPELPRAPLGATCNILAHRNKSNESAGSSRAHQSSDPVLLPVAALAASPVDGASDERKVLARPAEGVIQANRGGDRLCREESSRRGAYRRTQVNSEGARPQSRILGGNKTTAAYAWNWVHSIANCATLVMRCSRQPQATSRPVAAFRAR
jgi:hypothetical protein